MILEVIRGRKFEEEFTVDADKSISHRCAIFSLLTSGVNEIRNYLRAEDTLNSLTIAKALGAKIEDEGEVIRIYPGNITEPSDVLYCGNSGTTIRIYMGLLAGVNGFFVLTGDKYLRKRPMARVANPLRDIGALIDGRQNGNLAPLAIRGGGLKPFRYEGKIASAQVKSALILAGLNAKGESYYKEPFLSRDHTERMLSGMGADINTRINEDMSCEVVIKPMTKPLEPLNITVPNDPSSAFFFAVAAAITNSVAVIKDVTLNPTRIEAYKILEQMGAKIEYHLKEDKYEPIGDIIVRGGKLKGVEVNSRIAWLIDEIPALAMAMAVAEGKSKVSNAKELRVKESDRIKAVVDNLKKCSIEVKEFDDGFEIVGGIPKSAFVDSFGDHRIAMSFAVLGLLCGMKITQSESINTSFPGFFELFAKIAEFRITDEN